MDKMRGFGSRTGFVFCVAALGVGGFWRFPAAAARYGGAFVLLYFIMVLLVGVPGLLIELTLGRAARRAPVAGMQRLERTKPTPWSAVGVLGCVAAFLTAGAAAVHAGSWALGYLVKAADGSLAGQGPEALARTLGEFSGGALCVVFAAAEAALVWLCLHAGVRKGVERAHKILLPVLLGLLAALAVGANLLPGAAAGLRQFLAPDLSAVRGEAVAAAAAYALTTIGVGRCCAFVYGSYAPETCGVTKSALLAAALSAAAAVLAGLICVPALSSAGLEAGAGAALLYVALPQAWGAMGGFGRALGALYFLCVFLAGFLAVLGGAEALVASLTDSTRLPRRWACVAVAGALLVFGVLFSMAAGRFRVLGLEPEALAELAVDLCLCVGALLMALYVTIRWGFRKFRREVSAGSRRQLPSWSLPYLCALFPAVLIAVAFAVIRGHF